MEVKQENEAALTPPGNLGPYLLSSFVDMNVDVN
jgi:hypothetical protein